MVIAVIIFQPIRGDVCVILWQAQPTLERLHLRCLGKIVVGNFTYELWIQQVRMTIWTFEELCERLRVAHGGHCLQINTLLLYTNWRENLLQFYKVH